MAEQTKPRMIPKQRLEIVNIEIDVPYSQGAKQLDRVQAVNLSLPEGDPLAGKPLRMTIFNAELKPFIRGKKGIVADIEERPRDNSDYGPDRTIVQAYDDQGQPVSRKQGGGGGYQRRSLEDDLALEAVKRRSIEGQTAVAQVGALLTSQTDVNLEELALAAEAWARILGKYWKAVERGLDNYLADPPAKTQAEKLADRKPPATRQRPQEGQGTASRPAADPKPTAPPTDPIKHVGDLLTRASKLKPPVLPPALCQAFQVGDVKEIKDLEAAWKKAQEISKARATADGQSSEEAWASMNRS